MEKKPKESDFKCGVFEIHYNGRPTEYVPIVIIMGKKWALSRDQYSNALYPDMFSISAFKTINREEAEERAKKEKKRRFENALRSWDWAVSKTVERIIE